MPTPMILNDVLILHTTDRGWFCEVGDRRIFVAALQVESGTLVPAQDERGSLTIAPHAVEDIRQLLRNAAMR